MAALAAYLKKQAERGAKASYYNIDILKYQVSWLECFSLFFNMEDLDGNMSLKDLLHCTLVSTMVNFSQVKYIEAGIMVDLDTFVSFLGGFEFDFLYKRASF